MAALTGQYISQSYGGVINLSTNTGIATGSFTQLQDGFGTNLGVFLNGQGGISGSVMRLSGSIMTISGSTSGVVKALTISSQTASMDLSTADLFTLTLVSSTNTFLNPTNIKVGQTINLQITQPATVGTLSYPSTITFPSSNAYTASAITNAVDVISMISFNGSTLRAVSSNFFI